MNDKLTAFLNAEKDSLAHGDSEKDNEGVILCAQEESVPSKKVLGQADSRPIQIKGNVAPLFQDLVK